MFFFLVILVPILFVVFLVSSLVACRRSHFRVRALPCPPLHSFLFGHLTDLWSSPSYSEQLRRWTEQYGSLYGLFEGFRPVYVTSDVNFIEQVFIRQFSRFHSRRTTFSSRILGDEHGNVLTSNIAHQWKKQRTTLNPAFSGAKLKRLLPTIETCVDTFMHRLASTDKEVPLNIYELFKRLTMDVICRCAFATETRVQDDYPQSNIYMDKVEEFFAKDFERTPLAKIHRILSDPRLAYLCSLIFRVKRVMFGTDSSLPANLWLIKHMQNFVRHRIDQRDSAEVKDNRFTADLLQLMINAVHSNQSNLLPSELFSNVFITLIAGFETTSTALAYCAYRLSRHQDIQDKLTEEIIEHGSPSVDPSDLITSNKLVYLDLFLKEVLRMHPIAIQVLNRQCVQSTDVNGYPIDKGSLIQVDLLSVHFNTELWGPLPVDQFHPARHLAKRHPLAFMPFGGGPRLCLGMRFGLMEIKFSLLRLVNEYRILPSSNPNHHFNVQEHIVIAPENLFVQLERRSKSLLDV